MNKGIFWGKMDYGIKLQKAKWNTKQELILQCIWRFVFLFHSENNSPSQFATVRSYSTNTVFVLTDSSFHSTWCSVLNKKTPGSFLLARVWFTLEIGTFKSQTRHPPSLVTVQITMQNCNVQYRVFMFALQSTLGSTMEASHLICILMQRPHILASLHPAIDQMRRIITLLAHTVAEIVSLPVCLSVSRGQ